MLEEPRIVQTPEQQTAAITMSVSRENIQQAMGAGMNELRAALQAQGISPTGAIFTHHFRKPADTFDFEICLPVNVSVAASGRVKSSTIPAATVARTVYGGAYGGLSAAWQEFDAWIAAHGYVARADLWECYSVGPETTSDPAAWRTELNRPLDVPR